MTIQGRVTKKIAEPVRNRPGSVSLAPGKDPLGIGGMAIIQQAFDRDLGREVAFKALHPEYAHDEAARGAFIGEAQITAQLDHPNIVPIYEFGRFRAPNDTAGDALYLTMKRIHGRTLTEIIEAKDPTERTAKDLFSLVQIFLKVCDAMAFAHSRGVVHRDLKPDNIMVGDFGEVYVLDWGVALILPESGVASPTDEQKPEDNWVVGTPAYLSPEQAHGLQSKTDRRSDIFLLGASLYEMLTGSPPYSENEGIPLLTVGKAMACEIEMPQKRTQAALPAQLCRIAMKAMEREPEDRYQSVQELKEDIESFLQTYSYFPQKKFAAGSLVVREGDDAESAYVIVSGTCEVFKTVEGKAVSIREIGPGEIVGEISIFANQARSASVKAITEVTAVVITQEQIQGDSEHGYWIGLLTRSLAERFLEKERQIERLERKLARRERLSTSPSE